MRVLPIRLAPGTDLRLALEQVLADQGEQAGWVLSGIGSLSVAPLRLAGQEELTILEGDLEIITLAGSLSCDGAHLHISVAAADSQVSGGHLAFGAKVNTNAEVLIAFHLPGSSVADRSTMVFAEQAIWNSSRNNFVAVRHPWRQKREAVSFDPTGFGLIDSTRFFDLLSIRI